jgi:hypothetical protein
MHGGAKARIPKGDPRRGGQRLKHGGDKRLPASTLYANRLTADQRATFDGSPVGELDAEIRLARTLLDSYLAEHGLDAGGGLVVSRSDGKHTASQTVALHSESIGKILERIAKLERVRAKLIESGGGANQGDLEIHQAWLREQQRRRGEGGDGTPSSGS